jgi:hypothetical protein
MRKPLTAACSKPPKKPIRMMMMVAGVTFAPVVELKTG